MATRTDARAARPHLAALLCGNRHVTGIGLAPRGGRWALKVNLDCIDARTRQQIPAQIDGVPVVVAVVGRCRP